jgi:NAD(P)-dependent dehydrogenase (short-subunit alcohol dehydrogenase family)
LSSKLPFRLAGPVSGKWPDPDWSTTIASECRDKAALAADLDGSARASRELSHAAHHALGGRIDVLVNNAGSFPGSTTLTVDEAMFDEVYAVNVMAPFFLTAAGSE